MKQITIIHPSRCRPDRCLQTINNWVSKASSDANILYILSVDNSDPFLGEYQSIVNRFPSQGNFTFCITINDNKTAVEAINVAAKFEVKEGVNDLIVVVSDDFDCFQDWDSFLLSSLSDKEDYIVKTSDGIQDWIITLPIMDRKYYNRFGYIYYPEYQHMFCDTEMTSVADLLGKKIDLKNPSAVFRHNHYTTGLSQIDDINRKNDSTWVQGETLYNSRKQINFGIK